MGGTICLWYLYPYIYWYFLIFSYKLTVSNGVLIGNIEKCRVHLELWQFQLGGTICLWYLYPYIYWYFLIFSNKLTVSNGFSLMVWKCVAVTFLSSSFKWGEDISQSRFVCQIWAHLPFHALLHRRSFRITYERPNNVMSTVKMLVNCPPSLPIGRLTNMSFLCSSGHLT